MYVETTGDFVTVSAGCVVILIVVIVVICDVLATVLAVAACIVLVVVTANERKRISWKIKLQTRLICEAEWMYFMIDQTLVPPTGIVVCESIESIGSGGLEDRIPVMVGALSGAPWCAKCN